MRAKGSISRCCCRVSCVYFRDRFSRDDSTSLGSDWNEVSGDWEISSQSLVANAVGLVEILREQPETEIGSKMLLTGRVLLPNAGDSFRGLVAYDGTTGTNYLAAEFSVQADCGTITLYRILGGVETQISQVLSVPDLLPGTSHVFSVCYGKNSTSGTDLYLMASAAGGVIGSTSAVSAEGRIAGLEVTAKGADPVTFNSITLSYTYDGDDHPSCEVCTGIVGCNWADLMVTVTSLACNWDIVSGTWGPGSTSSSNAQAMLLTENPHRTNVMQAIGYFTTTANGDQIKVFLAGDEITATFEVGTSCGTMTIDGPDGSRSMQVAGLVPNVEHYFCVIYDGTDAIAGLVPNATYDIPRIHNIRRVSVPTTATATNYTAGLGTGTMTGTVTFRDVEYTIPYELDPLCGWCSDCLTGVYDASPQVGSKCEFEVRSGTLGGGETGNITLSSVGDYGMMNGGVGGANFVAATFTGGAYLQTVRVYLASDSTRSGPWGQIQFGRSTPFVSGVATLSSGESALVPQAIAGAEVTVNLCLTAGGLTMTVNPHPGLIPPADVSVVGTGTSTGNWGGIELIATGGGSLSVTEYHSAYLSHPYTDEECYDCVRICNPCQDSLFPAGFAVELAGMGAGGCCPNYDGSYMALTDGTCSARYSNNFLFSGDPCQVPGFISISFTSVGSNVIITVTVYFQVAYPAPGQFVNYRRTIPKPLNCRTISGLVIPYLSTSGAYDCDPTGSTITLTSF